ncbi:MAG: AAA family ATPase [Synergistaceae bacterium]|jgi:hypothetical protein|nr:AAA family ATPase [Synergistaceae bacterium]
MREDTNATGSNLPRLPRDVQTFRELREEGCVYIDKTGYLARMIDNGSFYFLSRPRKFGKSLLMSALAALFAGRRELFEGLDAEEFFDRPGYAACPVVQLDMSQVVKDGGPAEMVSSMVRLIREAGMAHGVEIPEGLSPGGALGSLIDGISRLRGPVVVLVDAADSPILDVAHLDNAAGSARDILREFLSSVKTHSGSLRFVLISGVSKLSKTNIFADFKPMRDISSDDDYADMLGFTDEELERGFSAHIDAAAGARGESRDELISRIRNYYRGFSFDGASRLYNPYSVLCFLSEGKFGNYWFDLGSQTVLSEHVRKNDVFTDIFRGIVVPSDFVTSSEIESQDVVRFLLQSGYLSVREKNGDSFTLDYSNKEVLSSMAHIIHHIKLKDHRASVKGTLLEKSIEQGRTEDLVRYFNLVMATIPQDVLVRAERKYSTRHENAAVTFYHAALFSLLWSSRLDTFIEGYSYRDQSGVTVENNGRRYIIELRVEDGDEACARSAEDAMSAIRSRGRPEGCRPGAVTALAMALDRTVRRVDRYILEMI